MIISEIKIKNFRSFGNSEQTLKLNEDKGELILLSGKNGAGKSSLLSAIDYSLFGKVSGGSKKKWATLSTLPNRINGGDLLTNIKFKSKSTDIEIKRGISPNILELWENGVLNERAGKSNLDSTIQDYIGMDLETFKSFISLRVDSFKNFISLSTEEKKVLLDKLFNLEVINILNSISKDLAKSNKLSLNSIDSEISILEDSINSIKSSIQKSLDQEKENVQLEIDSLKSVIESKKGEYKELKDKISKIEEKDKILKDELESEKREWYKINSELKLAGDEINLYNSGNCPTCKTPFCGEHFDNIRNILEEKSKNLNSIKSEIESNMSKIKERMVKLSSISKSVNQSFDDINYILRSSKSQIEKLELKGKNINKSNINIDEFLKNVEELEDKKKSNLDRSLYLREKETYYKELSKILSDNGVKKTIISGIINPINHFINENIKKIGLNFEVKLDETFSAVIKNYNSDIESDSLSTGEDKLVNISILCAYLMLIKTKKYVNILFMDEVFSSVDLDNIEKILILLKSFANDYKINIFVVHHAVLNVELFDRVIQIDKNIFTEINEMNYEGVF